MYTFKTLKLCINSKTHQLYIFIHILKGIDESFFRWENGVVLQGNLEQLEQWTILNGYDHQYSSFLSKVTALVSLLATPKKQLLKVS